MTNRIQVDNITWGVDYDNELAGEAFYNDCNPIIGYFGIHAEVEARFISKEIDWPFIRKVEFKSGCYETDVEALVAFIDEVAAVNRASVKVDRDVTVAAWERYYNGSVR